MLFISGVNSLIVSFSGVSNNMIWCHVWEEIKRMVYHGEVAIFILPMLKTRRSLLNISHLIHAFSKVCNKN